MTSPKVPGTPQAHFSFRSVFSAVWLLAIAGLLCAPVLHAQYRASIQGTVTDPTGAVIPGVTITLTNTATNQKQTAVSNGAGVYNFNALPPGSFKITAERSGFTTKTFNNVQITPEQANAFNIQLAISTKQTTVTVNAAQLPLMDTENATVGTTISSAQVQNMPTFGGDVFQLTQLAPGTISDMSQGASGGTYTLPGVQSSAVGPSNSSGIFATENGPQAFANGNQFQNNGIQVDGISTESAVWGGATVITPSQASVDDVRIMTNDYDAEYGRFSGSQTLVTTKSGTNHVHGSAFFQRWSPGLNAYQRYNGPGFYTTTCTNATTGLTGPCTPAQRGLNRDEQQFNQFGGSLGGPLWRNRLFAFFAYEGERSGITNNTANGWYDTPQFDKLTANGPIAAQYLSFPGAGVNGTEVPGESTCANIGLSNANCATVAGGINVGSPMTGVAAGTQDTTWTSATSPGVGGGLSTTPDLAYYTTIDPTTITDDQYNGRVDADITQKDRLTGTIYWVPSETTDYNGPVRSMNLWHHDVINDAFTGDWNHIFSANTLNEARANAAGWRYNEVDTNPQAPFGLPQDNIGTIGIKSPQFFGAPPPAIYNQWTYTYSDIVTKVVGRHNLKFGGDLTRLYYLSNNPGFARPTYSFFNLWDFLNDAPNAESGEFNPATGTPSPARQDFRENLWGAFVQDNFKVSQHLTLNLGLRYDYFASLYAKGNNLFSTRFGSGTALLTGLYIQHGGSLWNPQKYNFGPEFGFAYTPAHNNGKMVLRGGFGLNYNQEEIAISSQVFQNPGLTISPSFNISSPASCPSLSLACNPGIVYSTASNIHSLYGYPGNPAVTATGATAFAPNGLPTSSGAITAWTLPTDLPTMYVMHYSLEMESDLGYRTVFTLGYTGSQSRHTFFHYDENDVASVHGVPLNSKVNSVNFWGVNGHANYNSMIVTLRHEMSHQFQAEVNYNWAKSMDTSSAPYSEQDYPYDPQLTYAPSDYNVTSLVKIFGMWQPVFFRGHSWAEKIVAGWTLSGIFNWHTGFPWTPYFYTGANGTPSGSLYCTNCGTTYNQLLPTAYLGGAGRNTSNAAFKSGPGVGSGVNVNYPKAAAASNAYAYFAIPTYALGPTFPNAAGATAPLPQNPGIGRNSLPGPHYRDVDATLSKTFGMPRLREGSGLTLRADAFNVFNELNFNPSDISNNISSTNFGQDTGALGGRTLTLQANFNF